MTGTVHHATEVRVENRCLTRDGKVARKPWCVFVNDDVVSRHRWRGNADYRAQQLRDHFAEQVSE
jgi:hypothetical protein